VVEIEAGRGAAGSAGELYRLRKRRIASVLEPGRLIVAVRLPAGGRFSAHARYLKVRGRTPAPSRSCRRPPPYGSRPTIVEARIALGGVALKPWRARAAAGAASQTRNRR
jgi:xanthine dehydrogenase YagS FAD-binding subunit